MRWLGALGGVLVAASVLAGTPADAANSTTVTITVALRSVAVSPTAITFSSCNAGGSSTGSSLVVPNGNCNTANLTITNGAVAGHIDVNGADAIPSDNGTHWTLCSATGTACTGGGNATPGPDQFFESTTNNSFSTFLTSTPVCDTAFGGGTCVASANQSQTLEHLFMTGPSSSTDPATTFSTAVTWTAVP